MSVGLGLLHTLISTNSDRPFIPLLDSSINEESFSQKEKPVFKFIREHYMQYGSLPKMETVCRETGISFGVYPDEPIDYWVDKVIEREKKSIAIKVSKKIEAEIAKGGNIDTLRSDLSDLIIRLNSLGKDSKVTKLSDITSKVIETHNDKKLRSSLGGVSFGLRYLDLISDGAQPGDTIAICGRPGVGKSFLMYRMVVAAIHQGRNCLVLSGEMSEESYARRILALLSKISETALRVGKVSDFAMDTIQNVQSRLIEMEKRNVVHVLKASLATKVESVGLAALELKPDAIFIDGAYLLRARISKGSRWEQIADVADYLKGLAVTLNVPIIGTYQLNRKLEVAGSDVINQLASIIMSVSDDNTGDAERITGSKNKILNLLKGRNGEMGKIKLLYDMRRPKIEEIEVISGYLSGFQEDESLINE